MATATHWLEYGEPIDNDRVEARIRTEWETGPNGLRSDNVELGTIPMELLDVIEGHEHQHEDGSLLLSALDSDERERIEDAFEKSISARVDPHEIHQKTVGDDGRIYIGRDHAGEDVKVAIEYDR